MTITEKYAYLNWRMYKYDRVQNYAAMAEGYQLAASRLLNSLLENNVGHDADAVVFPILFSAHQALELYLKATIIAVSEANGLVDKSIEMPKEHKLDSLISSLNSRIENDSERLKKNKHTRPLFELCDLLKDVGSDEKNGYFPDFARFPESSKAHAYLYVKNDKFVFELSELKRKIDEGCTFISGYLAQWQDRAQSMNDLMQSEIGR